MAKDFSNCRESNCIKHNGRMMSNGKLRERVLYRDFAQEASIFDVDLCIQPLKTNCAIMLHGYIYSNYDTVFIV